MAVPRNRSSNARKNSRSSHAALKPKKIIKCSNCKNGVLPHRICSFCGFYANKEVIAQKVEEKK